MIYYKNDKLGLDLGKNKYEFKDFIQGMNKIIYAIYSIYVENKENQRKKSKLKTRN